MKVYTGTVTLLSSPPDFGPVYVEDLATHETSPLVHHAKHSPDGFSWGYGGSGPAELARCLLIDALNDHPSVEELYMAFKSQVIANLNRHKPWRMSQNEIRTWALNKASDLGISIEDREAVGEPMLAFLGCPDFDKHVFGTQCPTCGGTP